MLPCVLHEDDDLLVVNKPAGMNTHAPAPYAGEGLYDWLRHREPRWASLAIIHRLDKDTSGVMVFAKTPLANRSLTDQFTRRTVRKEYLLITDRPVPFIAQGQPPGAGQTGLSAPQPELLASSALAREGAKYVPRPESQGGKPARTLFRFFHGVETPRQFGATNVRRHALLYAEPLTGRTHQIRVHATELGIPILGDTLYGGTPAPRLYLFAEQLTLKHPSTGQALTFRAPARLDEAGQPQYLLRAALIDPRETDAYRLIHGAADGWPGWYVERLGDFLLSQSEAALRPDQRAELARLGSLVHARAAWHKTLTRQLRRTAPAAASPQAVAGLSSEPAGRDAGAPSEGAPGGTAPDRFIVRENGLKFELSFNEGYSVGLFLDQRDNRRRLLARHIAADFPFSQVIGSSAAGLEVLNSFAYTCAFSVCAAKAGARTTSLDLSKKYLDWGKRNFLLNDLDPADHDFIFGDAFAWFRRLARKARRFDLILLDPPTFSQSRESGVFRAEKDYGKLVTAALPLLRPGGVLFASTNAADWPPEEFLTQVTHAVRDARRTIHRQHYFPQPPDFPVSREEPAYLKTVWLQID